MSLIIRPGYDTKGPNGAVKLTMDQALKYQHSVVRNWDNWKDVYALRYGCGFMMAMAGTSAFFVNNHFRYKLKLNHYGRASSYLAVIATPAILSGLTHFTWVQTKLLLNNYECPLCLQTQAGLWQAASATIWPFALAPFAAFMFATRHFTYKLPSITEKPKEVFALWWKFTKSAKSLGISLFAINMLGGMLLTSKEFSQYANIMKEMEEEDRRIENDLLPLDVDTDIK